MSLPALVAGLIAAAANAHEFWIEPSTFTPDRGGLLAVRHCVGDGYEGWSLARNAERIEQFIAAGPAGEQPIVAPRAKQIGFGDEFQAQAHRLVNRIAARVADTNQGLRVA